MLHPAAMRLTRIYEQCGHQFPAYAEFEPRAVQTAQQIASLVNLSRAALVHADPIARVSLIKTLADQEGVRILPREPGDRFELLPPSALGERLTEELILRPGRGRAA